MRLDLVLAERTISLHAIGPDKIRLREPVEAAPCEAEVVMRVDDFEDRWAVYLPDGLSANQLEARTVQLSRTPRAAG